MKKRMHAVIAALAVLVMTLTSQSLTASATNAGTKSGNRTNTCAVNWLAETVMDTDLANNDPSYPNLMYDLQGNLVHFSNGGYINEVRQSLGDPGMMEVQHFYLGLITDRSDPNYLKTNASGTQVWRIPVATDRTIANAQVVVTLPGNVTPTSPVVFDPQSTNATIPNWGSDYAQYKWTPLAASAASGAGLSWTLDLGTLEAGEATIFQFNIPVGAGFDTTQPYIASAELSGSYVTGTCAPKEADFDDPVPTIDPNNVCQVEFLGETIWGAYDADITNRKKIYQGEVSDLIGEVNMDGWGAQVGADGWQAGKTRTARMYAATTQDLENVTWTIKAIQGATFTPDSINTLVSPAAGMLQANGFTGAADTSPDNLVIEASDDGTLITITVATMPAQSSISFNIGLRLDDAFTDGIKDPVVIHHDLLGSKPGCDPTPEPTPEPTEEPTQALEPTPTPTPTVNAKPAKLPKTGVSDDTQVPVALMAALVAVTALGIRHTSH